MRDSHPLFTPDSIINKNGPMKISVIIPTYKPQNYLWECLDSICNQSFPKEEYEIILVLNGCNEPYNRQINEYVKKHTEINWHYIQTDEPGVSNARNIALDVARGEYVTFIDDDDSVSPEFLSGMYDVVDKKNVALCYPYCFNDGKFEAQVSYGPTQEYERYHEKKEVTVNEARRFFAGPWMKLIHINIIGDRRFDVRFKNGEDSLFMFLISDRIENCRFSNRKAIYYRRWRDGSAYMGKRKRSEVVRTSISAMIQITEYYCRNPKGYSFYLLILRLIALIKTIIVNR